MPYAVVALHAELASYQKILIFIFFVDTPTISPPSLFATMTPIRFRHAAADEDAIFRRHYAAIIFSFASLPLMTPPEPPNIFAPPIRAIRTPPRYAAAICAAGRLPAARTRMMRARDIACAA